MWWQVLFGLVLTLTLQYHFVELIAATVIFDCDAHLRKRGIDLRGCHTLASSGLFCS